MFCVSRNLSINLGYPFFFFFAYDSTLIILSIFVESVVNLLLSFLILVLFKFSLYFVVHLAKALSVLLIFSKNQLVFVDFCLLIFSISFVSNLYYFLLLAVFFFFFWTLLPTVSVSGSGGKNSGISCY